MTSFTFNAGIPDAPNNPSVDQPDMKQNNQSTNLILAVDHVSFNSTGVGGPGSSGGQHLQVTFNGKNVPGGAPTDPLSFLFTNSGVASTVSDMRYQNANSIFPVSLIRAYGVFDATGTPVALQSMNLTCTAPVAGVYALTIATGAVNGATPTFGVLAMANQTGLGQILAPLYAYVTATTFNLGFRTANSGGLTTPAQGFTCIVFQL